MCRTVHALLQTLICAIQMLVRVFMTIILMLENLIRMILQTLYNFISFMLQMLSLIPICVVFLLTARLKCFMCGGGGPCPVNRGGTCDCLMSAVAIVIVFFVFRATGILDKIFYKLGYAKALGVTKFVPTPGDITECSRNDSTEKTSDFPDYFPDYPYSSTERMALVDADTSTGPFGVEGMVKPTDSTSNSSDAGESIKTTFTGDVNKTRQNQLTALSETTPPGEPHTEPGAETSNNSGDSSRMWTTVLYYLA